MDTKLEYHIFIMQVSMDENKKSDEQKQKEDDAKLDKI